MCRPQKRDIMSVSRACNVNLTAESNGKFLLIIIKPSIACWIIPHLMSGWHHTVRTSIGRKLFMISKYWLTQKLSKSLRTIARERSPIHFLKDQRFSLLNTDIFQGNFTAHFHREMSFEPFRITLSFLILFFFCTLNHQPCYTDLKSLLYFIICASFPAWFIVLTVFFKWFKCIFMFNCFFFSWWNAFASFNRCITNSS